MKRQRVYRLFSSFVNSYALLMAIGLIMQLFTLLSSAAGILQAFLSITTILYAWYANKFFIRVIVLKGTFTKKQKDLLQVNAIVVAIVAALGLFCSSVGLLLINQVRKALSDMYSTEISNTNLLALLIPLMLISLVLGIHVIWTYRLIRANQASIADESNIPD